MTNQTVTTLTTIQEIICRFAPKRRNDVAISRDTRLVEDLGIDSPRMIDIVLEVEDRFGVSLEDVDVQDTETVGELLALVEKRAAAKAN